MGGTTRLGLHDPLWISSTREGDWETSCSWARHQFVPDYSEGLRLWLGAVGWAISNSLAPEAASARDRITLVVPLFSLSSRIEYEGIDLCATAMVECLQLVLIMMRSQWCVVGCQQDSGSCPSGVLGCGDVVNDCLLLRGHLSLGEAF